MLTPMTWQSSSGELPARRASKPTAVVGAAQLLKPVSAGERLLSGYGAQLPIILGPWLTCSIFAVEFNQQGSRNFVVSTHEGFWRRYQAMLPQHRHCYEIIREGEPCHLYFGERLPGLTFGN